LEIPTNDSVIVGMDSLDDAGVYKISDDLAIIQTMILTASARSLPPML
jgi:selenophosphate synthase